MVAVIGDGAMSAGMAYEAMNNAGAMRSRLIVILNDNDMSIAPPTGAMSAYLARLVSGRAYRSTARRGQAARAAPAEVLLRQGAAHRRVRPQLLDWRHAVRGARLLLRRTDRRSQSRPSSADPEECARRAGRPGARPRRDQEGQGLPPAEAAADKYHGVTAFDVITGAQAKPKTNAPAYTRVFANALVEEARRDDKIVANHRRHAGRAPGSTR